MSIKFPLKEESPVFKWIEVKANSPHNNNRYIRFGLQKLEGAVNTILSNMNPFHHHDAKVRYSMFESRFLQVSVEQATKIAERIQAQFNVHVRVKTTEKQFTLFPGDRPKTYVIPEYIEITGAERLREIVQFADEEHYMTVEDRAAIHPFTREIEKQIAYSQTVQPAITPAQKDIIEAVATPYIDAIIDACANCNTKEELLGTAARFLDIEEPFSQRDLALAILMSSSRSLFFEGFNGLRGSCRDSHDALLQTYNGNSLEPTFAKQGLTIPSIREQRKVIWDLIQSKLTERFGPEPDPQNATHNKQLLMEMRKNLFVEGFDLEAFRIDHKQSPSKIELKPFETTIKALNGTIDPYYVRFWQNDEWIQEEAAQALLEQTKQAAMAVVFHF